MSPQSLSNLLTLVTAVVANDTSSDRPPPRIFGLDGTVEDKSAKHYEGPGSMAGHVSYMEASEATTPRSWSVDDGDDLEYENTRIKRRRVSVSPEHPSSETETTRATSTHQMALHDKLREAAKTYVEVEPPLGCAENQTTAGQPLLSDKESVMHSPLPIMSKESSSKSTRTIPYVQSSPDASSLPIDIDLTGSPVHQSPPTNSTMDDHSSKQSKLLATPRKKILRSDHGKLTFSPKRSNSPKRSSRTVETDTGGESSDAKKTTNRGKKLEMKNGKFVSSLRVTLSYTAPDSGPKINDILSGKSGKGSSEAGAAQAKVSWTNPGTGKATHPFFLGRLSSNIQKQPDLKSETSSTAAASEDETSSRSKPLKPWKDIIFEPRKSFQNKTAPSLPLIWPPTEIQHVQPTQVPNGAVTVRTLPLSRPKSKQHALRINADEDVLWNFSQDLKHKVDEPCIHIPGRRVMSGKELVRMIESMYGMDNQSSCQPASISNLKAVIESRPSSFDKGMAAGPQLWCHEYAPRCWQEVLEPQSKFLHDWLGNLKVHQVQTGKLQLKTKPSTPKRRRKRKSEMNDFIAYSDDDDARSTSSGKNAILLTGPPGSGKTASVFAVAQQLGFEVFEIHPGMRRSAKDIQDKVGDMTQNHLVQHADSSSRRSSVSIEDRDTASPTAEPLPETNNPITSLMAVGMGGKQAKIADMKDVKEPKIKSQKQSLVLFEEVDILFEEDKGFWSGVQALIRTSKRPVILTCNSVDSIPMDELDLFAVLQYGRAQPGLAAQLLGSICAAEGHLLRQEALQNLYLTKGQDLRASVMELNLWCQMTVGSQQGGLDWMLPYNDKYKLNADGSVTRIVSQDTFINGLDLLPTDFDDTEGLVQFTQDRLSIPPLDWVKDNMCTGRTEPNLVLTLNDMLILSEAKSAMDLVDDKTAPILASAIKKMSNPAPNFASAYPSRRDEVVGLCLDQLNESRLVQSTICEAFEPLLEESRLGLPSAPGRKAPSLDNHSAISLVTEVAPYIRYIVSHDQRLEQVRNELHGMSQHGTKRQRRTRAARAALEGGNKSTVRRDRWFPEELDWHAVMRTGNEWPQAKHADTWDGSAASTPSSSTRMEVEAAEPAVQKPCNSPVR
ncbi:uncharacterized protein Z519_01494 [Cladophialophora bantiana CBS 173.52]|uniref:AAA+ ATPase domain-containing protein n=1 Tax=Cladophialophora bantiana (strain ATCC 10958 / CBS 173.52 / CDC B-1940 / NIH 8579) TaxID=1442370 RepID=A0A0D2I3W7_CLAB1|nr:uncharacterized protein Z519_01494 [Cladophialophora bantiana CBS 173.52]KIW97910.1 hypothetical protein Z519_01494 [Cladophialophora bantiana CBS 173.52]